MKPGGSISVNITKTGMGWAGLEAKEMRGWKFLGWNVSCEEHISGLLTLIRGRVGIQDSTVQERF